MAIRCIAIRMSKGGHKHEHITHILWIPALNQGAKAQVNTRAEMVAFVEKGGKAYVEDDDGDVAYLGVRKSAAGNKYVQTYADRIWNDNLLALPRF